MIEASATSGPFLEARRDLLRNLERAPDGLAWCRDHTALIDGVVSEFHARVAAELPSAENIALIAVGGYGRLEMAPYSDIDLLAVPLDDAEPSLDDALRRLHRGLHAIFAAGGEVQLSYAFFLVNDAPALDPKTRTALLDARLVSGSRAAFDAFLHAFREGLPVGQFLLEKVRERDAAHRKFNDTSQAVEPNLKEGAGGLRSRHFGQWIRTVVGAELLAASADYEHVLMLRNILHLLAGKSADTLTRGRQAQVSERLKLPLAELFRRTADSLDGLFREEKAARELLHERRYALTDGATAEAGAVRLQPGASLSEAARAVAVGLPLKLRLALPLPELSNSVRGPDALSAIATGEETLRELDRAGVLGRLLPELDRCRGLMPEDSVHAYSVFEHSLRTVRNIERFPAESFYGRLREGLASPSTLLLAALLHDVGKAIGGRPHSETGAEIAADVAARWGVAPGIAANVEWLVRRHLVMARFIGMRDVGNPQTAEEFAQIVGDRERLDMLTLLTAADVDAVAPGAWTPAQDAFLRELHRRTMSHLESDLPVTDDPQTHRKRLLKHLRDHPTPDDEIEAFLEGLPAPYAMGTPAEMVPLHMRWVREAAGGKPTVNWDHDRELRLSEVTVCAADAPGLLSRILGVLYAFDLSVHGLRASTTRGAPAVALDTVLVSFGLHPVPPSTCTMAARVLREVLTGQTPLADVLRAHGKDPDRNQNDFSYNFIAGTPGILEVQAPRGRGMAFRISKMIAAAGWNIVSARFGQWAGRGAAAFYVLGPDGPLSLEQVESVLGV